MNTWVDLIIMRWDQSINNLVSWGSQPILRLFCWALLDFEGLHSPFCSGYWMYRWCSNFWLMLRKLLHVPLLIILYLFAVKKIVILIESDWIVLLIVKSQTSWMLSSSIISHGFDEVLSFIDNNFVWLGGIVFVFKVKLIWRKGLNGQVSGQDSSILCNNVCSFSNSSGSEVIEIWFVSLCHRYDINTQIIKPTNYNINSSTVNKI